MIEFLQEGQTPAWQLKPSNDNIYGRDDFQLYPMSADNYQTLAIIPIEITTIYRDYRKNGEEITSTG